MELWRDFKLLALGALLTGLAGPSLAQTDLVQDCHPPHRSVVLLSSNAGPAQFPAPIPR